MFFLIHQLTNKKRGYRLISVQININLKMFFGAIVKVLYSKKEGKIVMRKQIKKCMTLCTLVYCASVVICPNYAHTTGRMVAGMPEDNSDTMKNRLTTCSPREFESGKFDESSGDNFMPVGNTSKPGRKMKQLSIKNNQKEEKELYDKQRLFNNKEPSEIKVADQNKKPIQAKELSGANKSTAASSYLVPSSSLCTILDTGGNSSAMPLSSGQLIAAAVDALSAADDASSAADEYTSSSNATSSGDVSVRRKTRKKKKSSTNADGVMVLANHTEEADIPPLVLANHSNNMVLVPATQGGLVSGPVTVPMLPPTTFVLTQNYSVNIVNCAALPMVVNQVPALRIGAPAGVFGGVTASAVSPIGVVTVPSRTSSRSDQDDHTSDCNCRCLCGCACSGKSSSSRRK
jgi:hypothetical protein